MLGALGVVKVGDVYKDRQGNIRKAIEQAAAGSQDIYVKVNEISQAMEQVANIARNQTDVAQKLNIRIQKFRV